MAEISKGEQLYNAIVNDNIDRKCLNKKLLQRE